MNGQAIQLQVRGDLRRLMQVGAAVGLLTFAAGVVVAPARAWANLLLINYFLLGLGLAGLLFVALQYVTGAAWGAALRRVAEAMSAILPFALAGLAMVFAFRPELYPWTREHFDGFKGAWLNRPFFLFRAAVFAAAWILFSRAVLHHSRQQDVDGNAAHTRRNRAWSAAFLAVFAVTFWLASFDWIMSLEPQWYSTIFGIYNFAGLFASGIAALILLCVWLERCGPLRRLLRDEHLHDLGKLLFAFCTFWMYIWFSQYMLIWYANIPEEAQYFVRRLQGTWQPLFILNVFLNWIVPFLALLPRPAKRSASLLVKVAAVVLLGRWLDLYLMIMPALGDRPAVGIWELALAMGGAALFLAVFTRALRAAAIVPLHDPALQESLHYHN
jgi:hypothetical protein